VNIVPVTVGSRAGCDLIRTRSPIVFAAHREVEGLLALNRAVIQRSRLKSLVLHWIPFELEAHHIARCFADLGREGVVAWARLRLGVNLVSIVLWHRPGRVDCTFSCSHRGLILSRTRILYDSLGRNELGSRVEAVGLKCFQRISS